MINTICKHMYFKTHMFHNPFSQVFPALIAFICCWFKHTSSRSARSQFRLIQLFNIGPAHQLSGGKALKEIPNKKIETKYFHILIIKATLDNAISLYILTQYSQSLKKHNTKKSIKSHSKGRAWNNNYYYCGWCWSGCLVKPSFANINSFQGTQIVEEALH